MWIPQENSNFDLESPKPKMAESAGLAASLSFPHQPGLLVFPTLSHHLKRIDLLKHDEAVKSSSAVGFLLNPHHENSMTRQSHMWRSMFLSVPSCGFLSYGNIQTGFWRTANQSQHKEPVSWMFVMFPTCNPKSSSVFKMFLLWTLHSWFSYYILTSDDLSHQVDLVELSLQCSISEKGFLGIFFIYIYDPNTMLV